jgi:hypothetical protein
MRRHHKRVKRRNRALVRAPTMSSRTPQSKPPPKPFQLCCHEAPFIGAFCILLPRFQWKRSEWIGLFALVARRLCRCLPGPNRIVLVCTSALPQHQSAVPANVLILLLFHRNRPNDRLFKTIRILDLETQFCASFVHDFWGHFRPISGRSLTLTY